jgi:hypothetical protein
LHGKQKINAIAHQWFVTTRRLMRMRLVFLTSMPSAVVQAQYQWSRLMTGADSIAHKMLRDLSEDCAQ